MTWASAAVRLTVGPALQQWLVDPDLAGVRGVEALARLPEAERHEWQKLWDDVAELLARVNQTKSLADKPDAQ